MSTPKLKEDGLSGFFLDTFRNSKQKSEEAFNVYQNKITGIVESLKSIGVEFELHEKFEFYVRQDFLTPLWDYISKDHLEVINKQIKLGTVRYKNHAILPSSENQFLITAIFDFYQLDTESIEKLTAFSSSMNYANRMFVTSVKYTDNNRLTVVTQTCLDYEFNDMTVVANILAHMEISLFKLAAYFSSGGTSEDELLKMLGVLVDIEGKTHITLRIPVSHDYPRNPLTRDHIVQDLLRKRPELDITGDDWCTITLLNTINVNGIELLTSSVIKWWPTENFTTMLTSFSKRNEFNPYEFMNYDLIKSREHNHVGNQFIETRGGFNVISFFYKEYGSKEYINELLKQFDLMLGFTEFHLDNWYKVLGINAKKVG
jgi:hypothetical protein